MMRVSFCPASYLDKGMADECRKYGSIMTDGAKRFGYTDEFTELQRQAIQAGRRFDTMQPFLRPQKNRRDGFLGIINKTSTSIDDQLERETDERRQLFGRMVLVPAAMDQLMQIQQDMRGRSGAQGKVLLPGEMIGFVGVEMAGRDPSRIQAHVNTLLIPALATPDGATRSWDDARKIKSVDRREQYSLTFQLSVAKRAVEVMGWNIVVEKGMARIEGMTHTRPATANAKAREYLKARKIEPTPDAMKHARQNTRPKKEKFTPESDARRQKSWSYAGRQNPCTMTPLPPGYDKTFFHRWFEAHVALPLKRVVVAYRMSKKDGLPPKIRIEDLDRFLKVTAKRSVLRGHLGALIEIRKKQRRFLRNLSAGSRGYRKGREPEEKFPPGTRVLINESLFKSDAQRQEFEAKAKKLGWVLFVLKSDATQTAAQDRRQQQDEEQSRKSYRRIR